MEALAATPTRARDAWYDALNDAQRAAVDHGRVAAGVDAGVDGGVDAARGPARAAVPAGPLLVIAGAGTGKTMTLAARVTRLVLDGADPNRVLLLTFSRRAALEMQRRVGQTLQVALGLAATTSPRLPWCGTFHSIAARLLRAYGERIGLDPSFTIDDRGDAEDQLHLLRQRLGLAEGKSRFPQKGTCLAIYSRVVNACAGLDDVLAANWPWCGERAEALRRLFAAYDQEKLAQRVLDFDDLLVWWAEAMRDPALADEIGGRFDHVLIDEYQDTNRLQAEIVRALKPDGRGLTVVGDDAQSIYSFRAAEVRNILDFPAGYTPPARVVALERNYRATAPLLAASNAVIALAGERHEKRLWSERASTLRPQLVPVEGEAEQAAWVADRVLALRESGLALKSQAVLFRTAQHSHALELELTRRNVPFVKFGGLRFLDAAHVKDVLAVLRFVQNPRGQRAALRAFQLVEGVGAATAERLLAAASTAADPVALPSALVPATARHAWGGFAALVASLRRTDSPWPGEMALLRAWYVPQLERLHEQAAPRIADVDQLAAIAAQHVSRERFLSEMALDPPAASSEESGPPHRDEDYLVLSTIHSAKGQEWSAVSVLNVVDGCIPSDMATGSATEIDEERRLLYVAMTRARRHLHLLVPQRFYVHQQAAYGDRHVYAAISRFLPPEVQTLFERVAPAPAGSDAALARPAARDAPPSIALAAAERIRRRWR